MTKKIGFGKNAQKAMKYSFSKIKGSNFKDYFDSIDFDKELDYRFHAFENMDINDYDESELNAFEDNLEPDFENSFSNGKFKKDFNKMKNCGSWSSVSSYRYSNINGEEKSSYFNGINDNGDKTATISAKNKNGFYRQTFKNGKTTSYSCIPNKNLIEQEQIYLN